MHDGDVALHAPQTESDVAGVVDGYCPVIFLFTDSGEAARVRQRERERKKGVTSLSIFVNYSGGDSGVR